MIMAALMTAVIAMEVHAQTEQHALQQNALLDLIAILQAETAKIPMQAAASAQIVQQTYLPDFHGLGLRQITRTQEKHILQIQMRSLHCSTAMQVPAQQQAEGLALVQETLP